MSTETLTESHCEKCTLKDSSSCFFQANFFNRRRDRALSHDKVVVRAFRAEELILPKDRPYEYVAVVSSGAVKRIFHSHDGKDSIYAIGLKSSLMGMPFIEVPPYDLKATSEVVLCCLDRKEFENYVVEDRDIERAWLVNLLREQDNIQKLASLLHSVHAVERIGSFLLAFHESNGSETAGSVRIPISRLDLASILGTTPETISRCVQSMVRSRTLSIMDSRSYKVLDLPRLEEIAGISLCTIQKIFHGPTRSFVSKDSLKQIDLHRRAKRQRSSDITRQHIQLDITKLSIKNPQNLTPV